MADIRGYIRLTATIVGLAILCVLAYYVLLYLVRPHPAQADYPLPSDLPPGAQAYPGGYVVIPGNASNSTMESNGVIVTHDGGIPPGPVDTGGADGTVSFFELPLWIQLYALPGILFGAVTSFLTAATFLVIRHRRTDNRNKEEAMAYISGNPGCTAPEVARNRHMNIGTARYHIQRLQDEGRIVLEKIGKYSRIYVNSHTYDDREKRIASHLHGESSLLIIKTLMETPGLSNQKLSEKLGMEKSLVYRYMQKLLDDRIVTFEWEGKNKLYYIDAGAKGVLIKLMPLNYQCPGLKKE